MSLLSQSIKAEIKIFNTLIPIWSTNAGKKSSQGENIVALEITGKNLLEF